MREGNTIGFTAGLLSVRSCVKGIMGCKTARQIVAFQEAFARSKKTRI